jgi:hypothetical protein
MWVSALDNSGQVACRGSTVSSRSCTTHFQCRPLPGSCLLVPRIAPKSGLRSDYLPLSPHSALAALWLALGNATVAHSVPDEHSEIPRRPTAAARAEASERVVTLKDLAEGADLDAFHGPSMMLRQAPGVSLNNCWDRKKKARHLSAAGLSRISVIFKAETVSRRQLCSHCRHLHHRRPV